MTFPRRLDADVHVAQVALAALDDTGRRGRRGTGGSAVLIVPQAALLLDRRPVDRLQGGETLLARAAIAATRTRTTLAHALLVSQGRSAGRNF